MEEEEHREGEELRGFGTCRNCEKRIKTVPGKRRKIYCSEECRKAWWREHPERVEAGRRAVSLFTCHECGKPFTAPSKPGRKYCSHECYIAARFGGEE